jgi:hypothetical protein
MSPDHRFILLAHNIQKVSTKRPNGIGVSQTITCISIDRLSFLAIPVIPTLVPGPVYSVRHSYRVSADTLSTVHFIFKKHRVIKKSLCTWWLQHKKTQRSFKKFQSLTVITELESGITDDVSVGLVPPWPSKTQFGVSINVWRLAGDSLNITGNFLCCKHQVHRDFMITLHILSVKYEGVRCKITFKKRILISKKLLVPIDYIGNSLFFILLN